MHRKNAPGVFQLALMGNSQKALDEQVIKAYHSIQSFAPTDKVTPEEAHQIGMDFMKKHLMTDTLFSVPHTLTKTIFTTILLCVLPHVIY